MQAARLKRANASFSRQSLRRKSIARPALGLAEIVDLYTFVRHDAGESRHPAAADQHERGRDMRGSGEHTDAS